jgi:hypothetical protein
MKTANRPRRIALAPTCCRRPKLAGSGGAAPTLGAFLRDLKRFDPGLELHFFDTPPRWVLYRVLRKGICASEDVLLKEFEITGPKGQYRELGPWLLDLLRSLDKTDGGAIDPGHANRQYMRRLAEEDEKAELEMENRDRELQLNFYKDLVKYAFGRRGLHVNREVVSA